MARTVTMQQLIADARLWSDTRTSTPDTAHLSNTDVARIVALQMAELHEMLNSARASAFSETETTVAIVNGTGDLPDDFFSLRAAWVEWSTTNHESLANISAQQDATSYAGISWTEGGSKAFRVVGDQLRVFPEAASATIRIAYVPAFAEASEYDGVNGWEKMVTLGAAVEMLAIQNRANPTLEARYQEQKERVRDQIEERQGQDAAVIRDVGFDGRVSGGVGGGGGGPSTLGASLVTYSPIQSALLGTNTQAAIDELAGYATMAALRAVAPVNNKVAWTKTYSTLGDAGGGFWRGVTGASAGTYTHNGGTVIVPSGGNGSAAWLREDPSPARPEWWGVDGVDDSAAIDAASAWVGDNGGGAVLFTAPSYAYTFTQPPYGVQWVFEGGDFAREMVGGSGTVVRYLRPVVTYIDGPHGSTQVNVVANRVVAKGSGSLVPYTDYAHTIDIEKENWDSSSGEPEPGEINGIGIQLRQGVEDEADPGQKSGGAAILVGLSQLANSGFVQLLEAGNKVFTRGTLATERETQVSLLGINDRPGEEYSYGGVWSSATGTQTAMLYGIGTTASRWTTLLQSTLDSISRFLISDVGRIRWRSSTSVNIEVSQEDSTGDLVFKDTGGTEFYRLQQDRGMRALPLVDTGTAITLDKRHSGRIVVCANGSAITATLDAAAPVGTSIRVIQRDAGQVTFSPGSGASLRNRQTHTKTAGQYAVVTLEVTTNSGGAAIWYLSGDTAA